MGARDDDERVLRMLAMRASGVKPVAVAEILHTSVWAVERQTGRVRSADLAHADPRATEEDYRRAYPWRAA